MLSNTDEDGNSDSSSGCAAGAVGDSECAAEAKGDGGIYGNEYELLFYFIFPCASILPLRQNL